MGKGCVTLPIILTLVVARGEERRERERGEERRGE